MKNKQWITSLLPFGLIQVQRILTNRYSRTSISGYITSVQACSRLSTIGITKDGILLVNPEFANKWLRDKDNLRFVLLHELMHILLGHIFRNVDTIFNIAADAIINAYLYTDRSLSSKFLEEFYDDATIYSAILRPNSKLLTCSGVYSPDSRIKHIYSNLYRLDTYNVKKEDEIVADQVVYVLKLLAPPSKKITLIGSHSMDGTGGDPPPDAIPEGEYEGSVKPEEFDKKLSNEAKESLMEAMLPYAGYCSTLLKSLINIEHSKSLDIHRIDDFLLTSSVSDFVNVDIQPSRTSSPFPIQLSRRDAVLLSAGIWPGLFKKPISHELSHNRALYLFVDVSGSCTSILPKLIGSLYWLKSKLSSVYLFSNKVVKTTFDSLMSGEICTTGGTDFDCIAETLIKDNVSKAIIITDGYANMSDTNIKQLKQNKVELLTLLIDTDDQLLLKQFGEVLPVRME